jgi:hypothetical protein
MILIMIDDGVRGSLILIIIVLYELSPAIHREGVHQSRQLRYLWCHPGKVYLIYENKTLDLYVAKKISLEGLSFEEVDRTMREI